MTNVWLLPSGTDSASSSQDEDLLVRIDGEDAEIGRVTGGRVEWLGSVPASALGRLPAGGDGPTQVQDQTALIAVEGAASALAERGG